MPVSKELLEYQAVDAEVRKIRQALSATEESKKYAQAKKFMKLAPEKLESLERRAVELTALRDELAARSEEMKRAIAEYDDIDDLLEEGGDVSFYKKNAQALYDTLRALKADVAKLIAEITAASEEYQRFKKQTIAMQKQYREYKEKYEALEGERSEELKSLAAKQAELAKKIDARILSVYETKKKEKIFPIVVPLNGEFCICGRDFPLAQQGVLAGGNMVECENCHRLVYKN